jgi:hypothetical protein
MIEGGVIEDQNHAIRKTDRAFQIFRRSASRHRALATLVSTLLMGKKDA